MQVVAAGHLGPEGCDESASVTLTYSRGRTATLATHSRVTLPNEASIVTFIPTPILGWRQPV